MICLDVLDWNNWAVEQLSAYRVAPRLSDIHKSYFRGMAVIKSSRSGSLTYIYIFFLQQHFISSTHFVNWSTMPEIWHLEVPSSGMMSLEKQIVLNSLLFVRTPKIKFIISVTLWIGASECNCLTWINFPMALPAKHLVSRYRALRIFLVYFMHGIVLATSELVLVAISIEIMLTRMQLCGVKFESHSIISLS